MDIEDVSPASHGERERHYLHDFVGKTGTSPDLSHEDIQIAHNMATAEMLDEIHTMLRRLVTASCGG